MAVMFDFVDPMGADRRLWRFNRLSGDDEPSRKTLNAYTHARSIGRELGTFNRPSLCWPRRHLTRFLAYVHHGSNSDHYDRPASE
jgi:hypothetical protein